MYIYVDNISMLKLILVIYFSIGVLFNIFDLISYLYKRFIRNIKFIITEEEGFIAVRARIFKAILLIAFNITLLIIAIKV